MLSNLAEYKQAWFTCNTKPKHDEGEQILSSHFPFLSFPSMWLGGGLLYLHSQRSILCSVWIRDHKRKKTPWFKSLTLEFQCWNWLLRKLARFWYCQNSSFKHNNMSGLFKIKMKHWWKSVPSPVRIKDKGGYVYLLSHGWMLHTNWVTVTEFAALLITLDANSVLNRV